LYTPFIKDILQIGLASTHGRNHQSPNQQFKEQPVWSLFRFLMDVSLLKPIIRPVTRLIVSFIAVPFFRLVSRRVIRNEKFDTELEKDLEQWFRGALLLLFATQNMESILFPWVQPVIQSRYHASSTDDGAAQTDGAAKTGDAAQIESTDDANSTSDDSSSGESGLEVDKNKSGWLLLGLRVMLAIGVIQMMPDQELFAVIHNEPPKMKFEKGKKYWPQIKAQLKGYIQGQICLHLNRLSPVFAILATIAPGRAGWVCYALALIHYLIIGLITSRDKALNVLKIFDDTIERRRQEIIEEFHLEKEAAELDAQHDTKEESEIKEIKEESETKD
jgi:hypothetical protein